MNAGNMWRPLTLVGSLLTAFVAGAELPPAPELAVPPILSEARLWLDAWDYDTFTLNEQGGVLSWADKSGNGNDAVTYDGAALGTVGLTNGVPAFLMGDTGSGIDLMFNRMTDIRSVFWVMDIKGGKEGLSAVFLADSTKWANNHDFYRIDNAVFQWTCKAFSGNLWFGDRWLFTWAERRWSVRDVHLPVGTDVYSLSGSNDLSADSLSHPKDSETCSGGRALSELIVFNRTLSVEEVLQVKSYLTAKWKGLAPVTVNSTVTPSEVTGYDNLTIGEGASFVLTDASLGSSLAAPVNVWGKFAKTGKIHLDYRGHVWRRSQALFHVGQGGLTLDDFELAGIPTGATVTCDGKTLTMTIGGAVLEPPALASGANGPRLWLDAQEPDSFVTNATGGVLSWKDRSGFGNDATNYRYGDTWRYPVVGVTNGVPALLLNQDGSGLDLAFPEMDDIRTVFWTMDIADSKYASFLGSFVAGNDEWNTKGQAYQRSANSRQNRAGYFLWNSPEQVYQGEMREDGAPAKYGTETELRWICPSEGLHVYSHRVKDDIPAWANNLGRCGNVNYISGGKAISELMIFNRSLSDDERTAVESYQLLKWGLDEANEKIVDVCPIKSQKVFTSLTVERGNTASTTTSGSFSIDASALNADQPLIQVLGEFRKGSVSSIAIANTGVAPESGTYKLLQCANLFDCGANDFVFSRFPDNARFYWEGTTLFVRFLTHVEPLVPRVLSATDEAAPWLWLDASDSTTFARNEQGGVTRWTDKGARGNDATAYQLGDEQRYGTVDLTNGVSAYLMGGCGSGIDLKFARTTTARTMFWVMDIARDKKAWFLGDESVVNFERGDGGQYCKSTQTSFSDGVVREDGDIPHDKKSQPEGYQIWRCRPYDPGTTHVYSLQAAADMAASCLSADRSSAEVNGGRALSELVIFNRALTAAEVADVEAYMDLKWFGTTKTVTSAVDATGRVSYPNLTCGDGAAFTVKSRNLEADGEAAVTVHGLFEKTGDGKIVITNDDQRSRPGAVLFRCAGSYGLSLDSFEFVGFPEGTTFAWENDELKVTDCPVPGLILIVR